MLESGVLCNYHRENGLVTRGTVTASAHRQFTKHSQDRMDWDKTTAIDRLCRGGTRGSRSRLDPAVGSSPSITSDMPEKHKFGMPDRRWGVGDGVPPYRDVYAGSKNGWARL